MCIVAEDFNRMQRFWAPKPLEQQGGSLARGLRAGVLWQFGSAGRVSIRGHFALKRVCDESRIQEEEASSKTLTLCGHQSVR